MNSILTSKLKPLLDTLPGPRGIGLSEPHLDSARQVSLDLDSAGYGEGSVKLSCTLVYSPKDWVLLFVKVLHSHVTELAGELGLSFRACKIPSFYPKSGNFVLTAHL